jgi:hypothetical protein
MTGPCNDNVIVPHTRQGLSGHFTSKGYVIKRYNDAKQGIVWDHNGLGTNDSSLLLSAFFRLVIVFFVSLCVTMTQMTQSDPFDTNDANDTNDTNETDKGQRETGRRLI